MIPTHGEHGTIFVEGIMLSDHLAAIKEKDEQFATLLKKLERSNDAWISAKEEIEQWKRVLVTHVEEIAALKENELHLRAVIEEVAVWGKCREEYVSEIAALRESLEKEVGLIRIILDAVIGNKYASDLMAAQTLKDALKHCDIAQAALKEVKDE